MSTNTPSQLHSGQSQSTQTQSDPSPSKPSPSNSPLSTGRPAPANQAPAGNVPETVYPEVDFEHQKWPGEQRLAREERTNNCITRQLCRDILRQYYEILANNPSPTYIELVGSRVKVVLVSQDETVVLVAQSDGPVRQIDWSPGGRLRMFLKHMTDDSLIDDVEEETECWGFKPDENDDGIICFLFSMGELSQGLRSLSSLLLALYKSADPG